MRSGWLSALSVYRDPRILGITLLGFSSGMPLLLTGNILQAWLTQENIDLTSIGLFTLVGLPYTLKFLWAPILDSLHLPLLSRLFGRRRSWLLLLQAILMAATILLGYADPKSGLLYITIMAVAVAFTAASYDIIVDAFRIELCNEKNMAAGAATFVYGYRIAMWLTGFSSFIIADNFGWTVSYMVMAGFILIGVVTVLLTPEPKASEGLPVDAKPEGEKAYLGWLKSSVINPFVDFMKRPDWLVILLFTVLYKFGDSLAGAMSNPFYLQTGFTLTEVAQVVKTFGTVATFGGLFIGGWMLAATSMYRALWVCGILQMASNLMFAALAAIGPDLTFLAITIGLENVSGGMGTAVFVAYLSSLCNVAYTATQYALLSSLMAVARTVLVSPAGWLVERLGWMEFFILTTVAALPGLILLWYLSGRQPIEQTSGTS